MPKIVPFSLLMLLSGSTLGQTNVLSVTQQEVGYRRYNPGAGVFWGFGLAYNSDIEIRSSDEEVTVAINPPETRWHLRWDGFFFTVGRQTFASDRWSLWWVLSVMTNHGSSQVLTFDDSDSQRSSTRLVFQPSGSVDLNYFLTQRMSVFGRISLLRFGVRGRYSTSRETDEEGHSISRGSQYTVYFVGSPTSLSPGSLGLIYRF